MFLKGPHNEHIHHLITSHYTCTPLSMCHVESHSSLHWLMYTCLHRAKSYALFQIIGAFRSADVGLPSPTGHLPVIAFTERHRQTYYLLITLPSKLPSGPQLNDSAQFQSFSCAFFYPLVTDLSLTNSILRNPKTCSKVGRPTDIPGEHVDDADIEA
jgi:hypothetical protein